jgi:hypothetical protein
MQAVYVTRLATSGTNGIHQDHAVEAHDHFQQPQAPNARLRERYVIPLAARSRTLRDIDPNAIIRQYCIAQSNNQCLQPELSTKHGRLVNQVTGLLGIDLATNSPDTDDLIIPIYRFCAT